MGSEMCIRDRMDTLFSIQMRDVLESVNVLDEVRAALLHRGGDYGSMLSLIEHIEHGREGQVLAQMLSQMSLRPADLYAIQLAAIEWVTDYTRGF